MSPSSPAYTPIPPTITEETGPMAGFRKGLKVLGAVILAPMLACCLVISCLSLLWSVKRTEITRDRLNESPPLAPSLVKTHPFQARFARRMDRVGTVLSASYLPQVAPSIIRPIPVDVIYIACGPFPCHIQESYTMSAIDVAPYAQEDIPHIVHAFTGFGTFKQHRFGRTSTRKCPSETTKHSSFRIIVKPLLDIGLIEHGYTSMISVLGLRVKPSLAEKVAAKAKAELDAYATGVIHRLGERALAELNETPPRPALDV